MTAATDIQLTAFIIKTVVACGILIAFMVLLRVYGSRFMSGKPVSTDMGNNNIRIINRMYLGAKTALVAVRMQDKIILLSLDPSGVKKIDECLSKD